MLRIRDLADHYAARAITHPPATYAAPVLYCPRCRAQFSATPGDYFAAAPDTALRCGHCALDTTRANRPAPALRLAVLHTVIEVLA